ncbi:FMN-binding negative transcriptional regulator [Paraburkholderia xenovorans]|uniref:FMN-binding negative transcriptional regulator n=1 Tax=Paraburkholderia xenovorans TaxID=36873 RepID=UPI0038B94DA9
MYIPPHFDEPRTEVLHALIADNPFGMLITHGKSGLDANHIPFELHAGEGTHGVLHAHVARANPVWQDVADSDEVLVVFRAGDAYISPTWYPSKHELHKQVPTWNYRVVHAYGRVTIRDDERYVRGLVARLTRTHEASQPRPWKMTDSEPEFIDTLLKAIVGVEIEITRLVGKMKLSQNKEVRDIRGAGNALNESGEHAIGGAMLDFAAIKSAKDGGQ